MLLDTFAITRVYSRAEGINNYLSVNKTDDKSESGAGYNNDYGNNYANHSGNGAILAINGSYYGIQEKGYVLRNGTLYRKTAVKNNEYLIIYKNGSFSIINESEISAEELLANNAMHILSFGPALVTNGTISVSVGEEVGKAMTSNPRTAIGVIDDLHYIFVVSDWHTSSSECLTLYQLAEFMNTSATRCTHFL